MLGQGGQAHEPQPLSRLCRRLARRAAGARPDRAAHRCPCAAGGPARHRPDDRRRGDGRCAGRHRLARRTGRRAGDLSGPVRRAEVARRGLPDLPRYPDAAGETIRGRGHRRAGAEFRATARPRLRRDRAQSQEHRVLHRLPAPVPRSCPSADPATRAARCDLCRAGGVHGHELRDARLAHRVAHGAAGLAAGDALDQRPGADRRRHHDRRPAPGIRARHQFPVIAGTSPGTTVELSGLATGGMPILAASPPGFRGGRPRRPACPSGCGKCAGNAWRCPTCGASSVAGPRRPPRAPVPSRPRAPVRNDRSSCRAPRRSSCFNSSSVKPK